jgi:hypothetical protein
MICKTNTSKTIMSEQETKPEVTQEEVIEKTDDQKTYEELEAEAKSLEEQNKKLKEDKESDDIKFNQLRRLQKAREKNQALSQKEEPVVSHDIETRDLLTLSKTDIQEDSDEAKILKQYKDAGLIKSYAEGLEDVGIKAKIEALKAKNNAHAIIDENADEETKLVSRKEAIRRFQTTGEIPTDPKLLQELARENLKGIQ